MKLKTKFSIFSALLVLLSVGGVTSFLYYTEKKVLFNEMEEKEYTQKQCDEDNARSKAYIKAHYGEGSPRRTYHWEVRCGRRYLVEE